MIHRKLAPSLCCAAALTLLAASLQAQEPEQPEVSSMQWANASAALDIKFTLLGDVVADPWRLGGQVWAGPRGTLQWSAEFMTISGGSELKDSLELRAGQSGAAVLVGDFAEQGDGPTSGQLRPGFTEADGGKLVRAALLRFPVGKARESQYPVHLVNGIPDNLISVTASGVVHELEYAVPKSFKAAAGEQIKIKVSAPGLEREMSFTLEPYNRGGIIAFYRPADAERTAFVFVNLRSMDSITEMAQAQSRAESMEVQEESHSE
jgi:hypothetical protein